MDNIYKQKFVERVKKHINLVNKYASRVGEYFSEHDSDKLTEPLLSVYYLDMKSNNKTLSSSEQESLRQAGMNHRTENQHHPEFWDKGNIKNMTGLRTHPTTPFNVQKMPKRALIEMCADWCAMSEEFGNTPFEWFDYINGVRYNFSKSQEEFILNTLHKMWHNTDKSIDEEINEVLKLSGVN